MTQYSGLCCRVLNLERVTISGQVSAKGEELEDMMPGSLISASASALSISTLLISFSDKGLKDFVFFFPYMSCSNKFTASQVTSVSQLTFLLKSYIIDLNVMFQMIMVSPQMTGNP